MVKRVLSEEQEGEARRLYLGGMTQSQVGVALGVSQAKISRVVRDISRQKAMPPSAVPPADSREIPGWPDYRVTPQGDIYTCRWKGSPRGAAWRKLCTAEGPGGYRQVVLRNERGPVTKKLHPLILTTFVGPRPQGRLACHRNGVRTDNRVENLYWGTPKDNGQDMVKHGRSVRGERNSKAKLTAEQAVWAVEMSRGGASGVEIAKVLSVTPTTVYSILKGQTWGHATGLAKAGESESVEPGDVSPA